MFLVCLNYIIFCVFCSGRRRSIFVRFCRSIFIVVRRFKRFCMFVFLGDFLYF